MVDTRAAERRRLIKEVWPDKRLYASIMLMVAGLAGMLFSVLLLLLPVRLKVDVPRFLIDTWPPTGTLALCAGVVACAYLALRAGHTMWAFVGAGLGILSLGFLGLVPFLSLVAIVFLVMSRIEGEDETPATQDLTVHMWPDKSLAASLLLFVGSVVGLAWGGFLLGARFVVVSGAADYALGALSVVAALAGFAAAWLVYHQRGRGVALGAAVLQLVSVAFFVVGPILAVATLVLIGMAHRENEFDAAPA